MRGEAWTKTLGRASGHALKWIGRQNERFPPFAHTLQYLGYSSGVGWDLRRRGCDLVHVHNFSQFLPIVRRFNPDIKTVLHMHCEWLSQLEPGIVARRLAHTDLVVGCSHHVTKAIRKAHPTYAGQTATVYNGVDTADFPCRPRRSTRTDDASFRILFVSRISPEKGVHDLLTAFSHLKAVIPNSQLTLVGAFGSAPYMYIVGLSQDPLVSKLKQFYSASANSNDAYRTYIERMVHDHDLSGITFTGRLSHREVRSFYHGADVLVAPSLSEAFGMSIVEGMASGVPVVATRTGGIPEIVVDQITGLLVPPGCPDALADAILQLYHAPERRERMGQAGRARAETLFGWSNAVDQLLSAYSAIPNMPQPVTTHRSY
ncbi:glycosyltransferase family 4 protein [Longibacter salinarum]